MCSKWCPATKFFMSPEPFFQKVYADKVKWKYMINSIKTIDFIVIITGFNVVNFREYWNALTLFIFF